MRMLESKFKTFFFFTYIISKLDFFCYVLGKCYVCVHVFIIFDEDVIFIHDNNYGEEFIIFNL